MTQRLRSFGIAEDDLAVDLGGRNRAALVTRLLEQCTIDPDGTMPAGFYRECSAGKRLEYLLVVATGGPDQTFSLSFTCGGCGEAFELELTLEELSGLQREADAIEIVVVQLGGQRVEFRKPKGSDQERWAHMEFRDEVEATATMIETLAIDSGALGHASLESFSTIESALDAADPLIDFRCCVGCGECGEEHEYGVDLMETALAMLARTQHQLVVALHRLASHYHWSEREIFAIPQWRRRQYLQLIEASGR